jgi:3-dehydroquinate dehydratase II
LSLGIQKPPLRGTMFSITIIHGPNLNLLGKREPEIYGSQNFESFLMELKASYPDMNINFDQSNVEGEIVNMIQEYGAKSDFLILNAAAYSHTSIAIADAVAGIDTPVISIHLTNIYQREKERHTDLLAKYSKACLFGFGLEGYKMAMQYIDIELRIKD